MNTLTVSSFELLVSSVFALESWNLEFDSLVFAVVLDGNIGSSVPSQAAVSSASLNVSPFIVKSLPPVLPSSSYPASSDLDSNIRLPICGLKQSFP